MKYYIAYRYTGNDKVQLKKDLDFISDSIEKSGDNTFIFYRDIQKRGEVDMSLEKILEIDFEELEKCDVFFAFVDDEAKSEGMLIEAGYAYAKGIKIILAMKKGIKSNILESLASKTIVFENIEDLFE